MKFIPSGGSPIFRYQVAGVTFRSNLVLPSLRAMGEAPATAVARSSGSIEGLPRHRDRRSCVGLVDGRQRRCRVLWTSHRSFELEIEGVGSFVGHHDATGSCLLGPENTHLEEAVVLGPPLLLTLALHGVFCLHASAVLRAGEMAVFLGESGAGKSTLAASFARRGWHRLADDLLPVQRTSAGELTAWVDFPQLKIASAEPCEAQPPELTWVALNRAYLLLPPTGPEGELRATDLAPAVAVAALLQATVPWSLLSSSLARMWFSTLCEAVRQPAVRVSQWVYPHRPACLDQAFLEAS